MTNEVCVLGFVVRGISRPLLLLEFLAELQGFGPEELKVKVGWWRHNRAQDRVHQVAHVSGLRLLEVGTAEHACQELYLVVLFMAAERLGILLQLFAG